MSDLVDIENLRREVLAFTSPPPPFLIQQLSIAAAVRKTLLRPLHSTSPHTPNTTPSHPFPSSPSND